MYGYVRDHGPLSELLVLRMIIQMLDAILYLYNDFGILHRDIKPENILIFRTPYSSKSFTERFYNAIAQENSLNFKLCGRCCCIRWSVDFGFSGKNHDKCGTKCKLPYLLFTRLHSSRCL